MKIKLMALHPAQRILEQSTARFKVATCGRRFGKTFYCGNKLVKHAWEDKALCWWVAPTYQQTDIAYRLIKRNFPGAIKHKSDTDKMIELLSGGQIWFKSAEKYDNLRGEGLDYLVMDEASIIAREAWEEALRPTLSDKKGKAIFISTPKGRNWFYDIWMRGQDSLYPEWDSFKFPSVANPFIDPAEIEEAKRTLPTDVFRQEYEAEFLEDGSGVFRKIKRCVMGELEEPRDGVFYVCGVDLAKHSDFTVISIFDFNKRHLVYWERFNQIDYNIQVERIRNAVRRYNNAPVMLDSTGVGDPILESLIFHGVSAEGYHFTNTSKAQLIEGLANKIEQGWITFPNLPILINELETYAYEITNAGNIRYNAPTGKNDDAVISLALAAHKLPLPWPEHKEVKKIKDKYDWDDEREEYGWMSG